MFGQTKVYGSKPSCLFYMAGFYDDLVGGTFGTLSKTGVKRPLSNFNFEFCCKVVSAHSTSTGYLVRVIQEQEERESDGEDEDMPRFVLCYLHLHSLINCSHTGSTRNVFLHLPPQCGKISLWGKSTTPKEH